MTNEERAKALIALELLKLRAYSHAEISNGPKEMRDWIDRDFERVKAVLSPQQAAVDVDRLANFIRTIDGENTLGAGELAERISDYLHAQGLLKGGV